jgi:poly(3-hydroxybutyrate) depolymerase
MKTLTHASLLAALLSLGWHAQLHAQPAASASYLGGNLQIVWPVSSNFDSQVESSASFLNWQRLWPPYPAPVLNGFKTNSFSVSNTFQFFRVRYGFLTNSPVPVVPDVYTSLSFVSGGLARSYRLHIPTNYNAAVPAPLAFILHGHGQTADEFAGQHPALTQYAQAAGMMLVFPQSTSSERGTGWVDYDPAPGEPYVNDVQFLLELLEHLAATLNIDRQRVFAGGFSNGGQMVHYLGARTTNVFAAYATVGAGIGGSKGGTNIVYVPPPSEPVSILIVNATNDCRRPYWGGSNGDSLQAAALEQAYHWASNNLCLEAPVVLVSTQVINAAFRPNHYEDCPDLNPPPGTPWTNVVIRTTWMGGTHWTEAPATTSASTPTTKSSASFSAIAAATPPARRIISLSRPLPACTTGPFATRATGGSSASGFPPATLVQTRPT